MIALSEQAGGDGATSEVVKVLRGQLEDLTRQLKIKSDLINMVTTRVEQVYIQSTVLQ